VESIIELPTDLQLLQSDLTRPQVTAEMMGRRTMIHQPAIEVVSATLQMLGSGFTLVVPIVLILGSALFRAKDKNDKPKAE
jgi:hypothetical protein